LNYDNHFLLGLAGDVLGVNILLAKASIFMIVMIWVRWTLPRLRIDQVMMTCLTYLLPISCFLLLGVSLWEVAVRPLVGPYVSYAIFAACALGVLFLVYKLVTTPSKLPTPSVATPWAPPIPPGAMAGRS
jgi:NADH-quinone oxidoreductase subunit H